MNKKLPYSKQFIDDKDINEVVKSLQKEIITGGSTSLKFEKLFSKIVKSKYAVSCSNGTAALHLTSLALEISKKDCVIVPTITYAATANRFSIMGAKIVLCDLQTAIYPELRKIFIFTFETSGFKEIKISENVDFQKLYDLKKIQ